MQRYSKFLLPLLMVKTFAECSIRSSSIGKFQTAQEGTTSSSMSSTARATEKRIADTFFLESNEEDVDHKASKFQATRFATRRLRDEEEDDDVDNTFCYNALMFADLNRDRKVDSMEFVTFLKILGPGSGILTDVDTVQELPGVLRNNFLILACMCLNNVEEGSDGEPNDPQCCVGSNAHISNWGALPGEADTTTPSPKPYLDMVCFLSETSLKKYMNDLENNTMAPTVETTTTSSPTLATTTSNPTSMATPDTKTASPTMTPTTSSTTSLMPTIDNPSTTASPTSTTTRSMQPIMSPSNLTSNPTLGPSTAAEETSSPRTMAPTTTGTIIREVTVSYVVGIRPQFLARQPQSPEPPLPEDPQQEYYDNTNNDNSYNHNLMINQQATYHRLLVDAMNIVAPQIANSMMIDGNRRLHYSRRFLLQRRLSSINVVIPTKVDGTTVSICPDFISSDDRCEDVFASIQVILDSSHKSPGEVADAFERELDGAITNGRLEKALEQVLETEQEEGYGELSNMLYVVTGLTNGAENEEKGGGSSGDNTPPNNDEDDGNINETTEASESKLRLSPGAMTGFLILVSIGLTFVMLLLVRQLKRRRRRTEQLQNESVPYVKDFTNEAESGLSRQHNNMTESKCKKREEEARARKVFKSSKKARKRRKDARSTASSRDHRPKHSQHAGNKDDDSSHAGSSGWSSQNDMSSEASSDDGDSMLRVGSLLNSPSSAKKGSTPAHKALDQAIEKGDWATVEVTAALLASQPKGGRQKNEEKISSNNKSRHKFGMFFTNSSGEKYQYVEKTPTNNTADGSVSSRGSYSTNEGSSTEVSGVDSSVAMTVGGSNCSSSSVLTTPSEAHFRERHLADIRAEVDELIQYVVPEERTHINEMMSHFHGNEEVLLETLRSMKEKSIAEKARAESHRLARQNIKDQNNQLPMKDEDLQLQQLYAAAVDNTGASVDNRWSNNDVEGGKAMPPNGKPSSSSSPPPPPPQAIASISSEQGVGDVVRGAISGSIKGLTQAFGDAL